MKIYINLVRFSCALAKLPDVENTQFHHGFLSRMRKISEPIANDLALIIRLLNAEESPTNGVSHIYLVRVQLKRLDQNLIILPRCYSSDRDPAGGEGAANSSRGQDYS